MIMDLQVDVVRVEPSLKFRQEFWMWQAYGPSDIFIDLK
jgi:hypothetical protein